MSKLQIKSVSIENMHSVSNKFYELKPGLNYIQGPNGIGKSTVMQAIQLGLLGYIPGTNKQNSAIFAHSNSKIMSVAVNLQSDDGGTVSVKRSWYSSGKSSVMSDVVITPETYDLQKVLGELEMPIFNFNEFVGLTANKMKDWFINFLPKSSTEIDWDAALTNCLMENHIGIGESEQKIIKETLGNVDRTCKGTEQVKKFNEYLKSALSFKKAELQRLQGTIQSLVYYDDFEPDMTEVDAQVKVRQCTRTIEELEINIRNRRRRMEEIEKLERLGLEDGPVETCKEYHELNSRLEACVQSIDELMGKVSRAKELQSELKLQISSRQSVVAGKGVCPYTKSTCESISGMVAQYEKEIEEMNAKVASYAEDIAANDSKLLQVNQERNACYQKLMDLRQAYSERNAILGNLTEYDDSMTEDQMQERIQFCRGEIDRYNETIGKLKANATYNEMVERLTADKFEIERAMELYKFWINLTGVNGMQASDDAIAPFIILADHITEKLQSFFSQGVQAKFNLASVANSFSFGIERDGSYIPFDILSSGEKCLYTLAMMMSLIEFSNSSLKLIMVDDLLDHLDDEKIEMLFSYLRKQENLQVILAGVKPVSEAYKDAHIDV